MTFEQSIQAIQEEAERRYPVRATDCRLARLRQLSKREQWIRRESEKLKQQQAAEKQIH